ncbi:MAG TPA: sulfite exporter TauE/SafE family protein [Candidatus Dormibacteraeota bacterium]|nr:sulfite exporter TauE/SafE family protein [Candidatus Dormibacteraeota bacterium]
MNPRRILVALVVALAAVLVPVAASAHPLGNFTVNHATVVQLDGDQLRVRHVIDMAEIPTFQAKQAMGGDGAAWLQQRAQMVRDAVQVSVDGHAVALSIADRSMAFGPGQAGLQTLRVEVLLSAAVSPGVSHSITVHDADDAGRIGWREVTVQASGGAAVEAADVPSSSPSDLLRSYPQDRLTSPLDVADAHLQMRAGLGGGGSTLLGPLGGAATSARDGLVDLLDSHGNGALLLLAVFAAMALGAAHALSPGHGKTVMAGYLAGTRGTWRDAVMLGATITVTHTAGVFALGFLTLFAASVIAPDRLYPVLTLGSGALILAVGLLLVVVRLRSARRGGPLAALAPHHDHDHAHGHAHPHHHSHDAHGAHAHAHPHPRRASRRGLLALGVAGGLVPCPSALLVLLAAVSLHRIAGGIVLIVAFSAGLALVLVGIGVAIASGARIARRVPRVARVRGMQRVAAALPVASALLISAAGLGLTVQALSGVA